MEKKKSEGLGLNCVVLRYILFLSEEDLCLHYDISGVISADKIVSYPTVSVINGQLMMCSK